MIAGCVSMFTLKQGKENIINSKEYWIFFVYMIIVNFVVFSILHIL